MARLLFRLKDVPDDEANAIRELLNEHGIPCYETDEGLWRVGLAAIWVRDNDRYDEARALIDTFESGLQQDPLRDDSPQTVTETLLAHPLRSLMAILAIVVIIALSLYPFWVEMHP